MIPEGANYVVEWEDRYQRLQREIDAYFTGPRPHWWQLWKWPGYNRRRARHALFRDAACAASATALLLRLRKK